MPATAAGIDIGGTGLKLALVRLDETVAIGPVTLIENHATADPRVIIESIARAIRESLDAAGLSINDLAAVGVGCAGLVDGARGVVHTSPNLPSWHEVPIREELAARLPVPVRLVNDASAFLAAEWL
ncbi:MAG: glucokinase, partial [bacterium]